MTPRIVVDASITLSWCFRDEKNALAEMVLDSLPAQEIIVPAIWPLEITNVLLIAERKGRLTRTETERFLVILGKLPITIDTICGTAISEQIFSLGRDYHLTSYDASYLELAMREGIPLATSDAAMRRAMDALGIPLFSGETVGN